MSSLGMNRFEWLKAVVQDGDLTPISRVVATALSVKFANDETGQINPSVRTLSDYLATSKDTIKRAIKALVDAGWLGRTEGRGRGNKTEFTLCSPCKIVPISTPNKGRNTAPLRRKKGASLHGKGRKTAPSYNKDKQSLNNKRIRQGERPTQHMAVVVSGTWQADAWNKWLADHKFPSLQEIDLRASDATNYGYDMPWSSPPNTDDQIGSKIAEQFVWWAIDQMIDGSRSA